ncbi:MAG: hypothetical protein U0527_09955 [Candidatus Eisenbacteria bacterium]
MFRTRVRWIDGARFSALALVAVSLILAASARADEAPDALDDALGLAGLTRADLGWEPRGFWERYPEDIPYKLRHLDSIVSEPLAVVPFTRMMGATLVQTLSPENVANRALPGALYRAVHDIGVNKRYGATRSYSANLSAKPTPLDEALLACWPAGDRKTATMTFGNGSDVTAKTDLTKACAMVPPEVSGILGQLVLNLLEAQHWGELAFRDVPLETRARIAARIDIGEEMTDAQEYEPAFDDAAHAWDEASLWYAGLKTVEALDVARHALADTLGDVKDKRSLTDLRIDVDTPVGRVVIDGTGGHDLAVGESGALLVVDLGGDDRYTGPLAASSLTRVVGAALDLGGNDSYTAKNVALGAGLCGVGVLLDADGSDTYTSERLAQGGAQFGLGALIDLAGDDTYMNHFAGQGAGCFGVGMLVDLEGRDSYTVWGDGQGYATAGGVGVLADRAGDDTYLAIVDPAITGHPSAHSENKISASGAQGCGMGRRGDGSDGHSWAGGLGVILDASGDDSYTIGNWGQGCGYWFGTGLMWDGGGNDQYRGTGWTSASGAHFAVGAVIDESGDDLHSNAQNWGPAYGHDFVVSVLYDGSGNDVYECGSEGVGHSINRSVALCLDAGGDDRYVMATKDKHPGDARYDPRFIDRTGTSIYWSESTSLGLFLDVGGTDVYPEGWSNDMAKTDEPGSDNARSRNRAVFVDRAEGRIDVDRALGGHRK